VNGPSKGGILVCEECGQRVVLDAPLSVSSSRSATFSCQCGERLALAGGLDHSGSVEASRATNAASPITPPQP
jgi:hypothetical protein